MKHTFLAYFIIFITFSFYAQDPQLSQFYSSPQYLNPAFTGLTAEHRLVANYRNQWPGITKNFQTLFAAYDYNASEVNSGMGIIIMQDKAGTSGLSHTQAGLSYAYRFTIKKLSELRAGINASYNSISIGYSKLQFNDQLVTGSAVSIDGTGIGRKNYLDLNAGLLFNSEKFWMGVAAKHLNRPNCSVSGFGESLPVLLGLHAGYRYIIEAKGNSRTLLEKYVAASVNYKHQLVNDQLDLGFYYYHAPLNVGLWYRGIPFKKYPGYGNNESFSVLVGFEIPQRNLRVGYSYDLTISSLGVTASKGAHEIALVYEIAQKAKYKTRKVLVTCPKF